MGALGPLLGGSWASLGRLLASLGASRAPSGTLLGATLASKTHFRSALHLRSSQKLSKRPPGRVPGASREGRRSLPGALLGRFWPLQDLPKPPPTAPQDSPPTYILATCARFQAQGSAAVGEACKLKMISVIKIIN